MSPAYAMTWIHTSLCNGDQSLSPKEVFMLRVTITCLLATGALAGCANLQAPNWAAGYCSVGSNRNCPELEGDGDCQPFQAGNLTNGRKHLSANTLAQRLP
jgi:hypothetical protein